MPENSWGRLDECALTRHMPEIVAQAVAVNAEDTVLEVERVNRPRRRTPRRRDPPRRRAASSRAIRTGR